MHLQQIFAPVAGFQGHIQRYFVMNFVLKLEKVIF